MILDIIDKKRLGKELSYKELDYFFNGYLNGDICDYQMSAFLMAVYFQNMSIQETSTWTEELMLSGDIIDCGNTNWPKIGYCSTGGVGDKSVFVLMALAASCGIAMPILDDGHSGMIISHLDKILSIPHFDPTFDSKKFKSQLKKIGG